MNKHATIEEQFLNVFNFRSCPKNIRGFFMRIKMFFVGLKRMYQRGTRGVSDGDLGDVGIYIASVALESIRRADNKSLTCIPDGMSEEEWDQILMSIITGLERGNPIAVEDATDYMMKSISGDTLANKKEAAHESRKRHAELRNSFDLIGKYIDNLRW